MTVKKEKSEKSRILIADDNQPNVELLEAYRNLPQLRQGGTAVVNHLKIIPATVAMGKETYPEDIPGKLETQVDDVVLVDGMEKAVKAGNYRTVNTVLLGALSNRMDIDENLWVKALEKLVPEKFLQENLKAFELGRETGITD